MKSRPAVIIGSSGQVAGALRAELAARGIPFVSTSSKSGVDLGAPETVRAFFASYKGGPSEVYLAGAMTHVDRCEEERSLCERVNAVGPGIVAEECARAGHKLTYFSTEYVYGNAEYGGGPVGPFSETDPTSPPCWYGACKLDGEKAVQRVLGLEALILRTTMVFSWAEGGTNFLMQYARQLDELMAGRTPNVFRIPEDQISTPTYAPWLARSTLDLRAHGEGGVFNLVGSDLLSRRELVERVIRELGYDRARSLQGFQFLKTAELGQKARRPLTAGLRMEKAIQHGVKPCTLADAFAEIRKIRGY